MIGLKHFPDKPFEQQPKDIPSWDNGESVCEQKVDGWRMEILKGLGDSINFISRHNKLMNDRVEQHIQEQVKLLMAGVPERSQLDGEWLSVRESTNKKIKPFLVIFDVYRYDKRWLLRTPLRERRRLLKEIFAKVDPALLPNVTLVETAPDGEFSAFYEAQKSLPQSEGVVIKRLDSTLLGDRKESKKNAQWTKIKFRGCSSGQELLSHLR